MCYLSYKSFIFCVQVFAIGVHSFQSASKSDYILPGLIIMVALNGKEQPPEPNPVFKFHIKVTLSQVVIICLYFVHLTMDGRTVGPDWFGFSVRSGRPCI